VGVSALMRYHAKTNDHAEVMGGRIKLANDVTYKRYSRVLLE